MLLTQNQTNKATKEDIFSEICIVIFTWFRDLKLKPEDSDWFCLTNTMASIFSLSINLWIKIHIVNNNHISSR